MLFPGYAVLGVRRIWSFPLQITKKQTRPEITKIFRNITVPNPTQHTSLPDVTQETRGALKCHSRGHRYTSLRIYHVPSTGH